MTRVVITDHEFHDLRLETEIARASGADLEVHSTRDQADVARITAGADVVMLCYAPITRAVLAGLAPGATVIRYGIGFETIDVQAAAELGVRVCNVPDYGADTVADHTVMLALAALRRARDFDRSIRAHDDGWMTAADIGPIPALSGVVYGLVGTGQIGRKVAHRIRAFGSSVVAYDPYASADDLAELGIELTDLDSVVARADVVSIHAPLTPETHHIIDAERIASMTPGTVIVNTARGALLDTTATAAALHSGHLGGAGLDVFETEPLEPGHPIRTAPRTVLSPHAAFYSTQSLENLQRFAAEEMGRAVRGEELRCQVNRHAFAG